MNEMLQKYKGKISRVRGRKKMKQRRNKRVMLLAGLLFLVMFFTVSVHAEAGWKQNTNGTWSYYSSSGNLVKKKWISGTYYVNAKGVRQVGWLTLNGQRYFFSKSGKVLKNIWFKSGKYMYYAGPDGALYTNGIHTIGDDSYLFSKNGVRLTGKRTVNGKTYYFRKSQNGRMQKDIWIKTGTKYYYYGSDGVMLKNQWIGRYYVGKTGARLTGTWKDNRYLNKTGKAVKGLQEIGGVYYYFNSETYEKTVSTSITVDGITYEFDSEGKGTIVSSNNAPPTTVSVEKTYYTDPYVEDETLLAAIIHCEAGNQTYTGKLAVGIVIYNRMYSSSFPEKLREVVYQKSQFTPARDGSLTKVLKDPQLIDDNSVLAASALVKKFENYVAGTKVKLKIKGKNVLFPYLFFMTPKAYASSGCTAKYLTLGDHVFFKTWS